MRAYQLSIMISKAILYSRFACLFYILFYLNTVCMRFIHSSSDGGEDKVLEWVIGGGERGGEVKVNAK